MAFGELGLDSQIFVQSLAGANFKQIQKTLNRPLINNVDGIFIFLQKETDLCGTTKSCVSREEK